MSSLKNEEMSSLKNEITVLKAQMNKIIMMVKWLTHLVIFIIFNKFF